MSSVALDGTVSTYLFERVKQLGVGSVFGVPGDFNLAVLEHLEMNTDLEWIGCCNELNAAYAADGYARVKRRPGFLITTYGVGELSSLNGIAGARAESVPIVHIVGMTGRPVQEEKLRIHHVQLDPVMSEPDHLLYTRSSDPFSVCSEVITDLEKAPQQIDHVIEQVIKHSSPGYIYLPVDMFLRPCEQSGLQTKLNLTLGPDCDANIAEKVANEIAEAMYTAKNPCLLVDMYAERFLTREQMKTFMERTKMWTYTCALGKAAIDENHDQFVGVYNGLASAGGVAEAIHASDLVVNLGVMLTDSNTGGFTREIKDENAILLHPRYVNVKGNLHKDVNFVPVFEKLVEILDYSKLATPNAGSKPEVKDVEQEDPYGEGMISETQLVETLTKSMQAQDALLIETGTFQFAAADIKLKENSDFATQIFFSSIGYTLPAALGTAIAQREQKSLGRTVLVEGDGSAQMTIQELGTMMRQRLNPIILLINNEGYAIERAIFGPTRKFNDICPDWKWTKLCEAMGGTDETVANHVVKSQAELDQLMPTLSKDKMHMVEVFTGKFEYPWRLKYQVKNMGAKNFAMFADYAKKHDKV